MQPTAPVRRVLLSIGGHLGDAVIATTVLPVLRRSLPRAEIGVLAPSWAAPVFQGHTDIRRLHLVDHWKLRRDDATLWARLKAYLADARRVVAELREVRYDLAIDLYPYYPNTAFLLWRAGIQVACGAWCSQF